MQSDLAIARDSRNADAMEKARHQQEQTNIAMNAPPIPTSTAAVNGPSTAPEKAPSKAKKKKKTPDYFTAQVPGEKKTKKAAKKTAAKQKSNPS